MIIHARLRFSNFLIVLLILLIFSPAVSFADANRIFKENGKAVVVVTAYDEKGNEISQGSGFIVRADGAVVTNYHVIGMAKDIKIKVWDKVLDVEGLIFIDNKNDLAILKAKAKDMPVVKLGVTGKTNIGEHIYVIGYPLGLKNTISVGLLSGIRKIDNKREILKMTAPTSPGSSGSPVFNKNGEVIGVVTSSPISETRNSSFAISVKLIKDKISSKSVTAIKDSGLEDYINTAIYWNYLGDTYLRSGKYKEAVKLFKEAIRIDPNYAEFHYDLGEAYDKLGMYKEAIGAHKQAIRINPDYAEAYNNLGAAFIKLGMHKEGLEACKQAIRIDPAIAEAHYNLGFAYVNFGRYKEAIEACKQAIWINPTFAEPYYTLGAAYVKLGINKEGMEAFKQAIRINPDYAEAQCGLGFTYDYFGMYKKAIEAYRQAIRINPDYTEAHNNLGIAYVKSGMYKEGIASFKQAIRIDPDYAEARYLLGATYTLLNDKVSALEQYKILKSLDSEMANKLFNSIYK